MGTETRQPRQEYSPETKAAVMAALLAGQSVSQAAKAYSIPRGTVGRWSAEIETERYRKKAEIGELLIEYLKEGLTTLREQVKVFRDEAWLKEQSASELAVLHGVIADKQIRLLEALADEDPADEGKDGSAPADD